MKPMNDSHIPNDKTVHEDGPLPQHYRLALGEKVTGQEANPNGAATGPTERKIANNQGKTY